MEILLEKISFLKNILHLIRSIKQLVVPVKFRQEVLQTGHDYLLVTCGERNLLLKFSPNSFSWELSAMSANMSVHAKCVKRCLTKVLSLKHPFSLVIFLRVRSKKKIAVDIVDGLFLSSTRGHRFILSLMQTCFKWVERTPLKIYRRNSFPYFLSCEFP